MAVVGHWENLAEAEKLTQSWLLSGVIDTVIESGQLLPRMPMKQISGLDLVYNREKSSNAQDGAGFYDIREQISWTSDLSYDKVTVPLKRVIRQDPIDKFVEMTYNNVNDYRALMLTQLAKRVTRFLEHQIIYGDVTYGGAKQFDGLHAMAEELTGDLDVDMNEAGLSLMTMRKTLDACKVDPDKAGAEGVFWLFPREIARRLSAAYFEQGIDSGATNIFNQASLISQTVNDAGRRVMAFDNIPIVVSDFLQAEQDNTGVGSDARALYTADDKQYSVFLIRMGQTEDGGLSMLFGGGGNEVGEVFRRETFEKLEDFDSGGERLVTYMAPALGAQHSLARIYDIEDVAVVV